MRFIGVVMAIVLSQLILVFPSVWAGNNVCETYYRREHTDDCSVDIGMSAMELRVAYAEMERSPVPNVSIVEPDPEIVYQRRFRRLNGVVPVLDAPGGNVIREIEAGYNYVTYINWSDGYYQINSGEWVSEQYATDAEVSEFAGVEVNGVLERPFFWMLAAERPSRYPGGPPDETAEVIPRYAIRNIYGVEVANGWEWYLIGPDQWVQQLRVAKVNPVERPGEISTTDRWFGVDLYEQVMMAFEGDKLVYATLISSGLPQWSTNEGLFRVQSRWTHGRMTGATGLPDFYFIEDVPWILYFDGDIALHGTFWHDRFGYRQSHGCVNLSIMDAKWAHTFTAPEEYNNAWVYVYSSGEYQPDLPNWARR